MVKIRACGSVAVPVVVVEGVGLLATGVVVQDDTWARRGGIALMCLHELGLGLFELGDDGSYVVVVRNRKSDIAMFVKRVSNLVVSHRHHYR